MQKTSKVTNVSYGNAYTDKYGQKHNHWIDFDNGDRGQYSSVSETQTKFVIGETVTYEIYEKNGFKKVKLVQPNTFNGKPKDDRKRQYMIMLQSSTDYAIKVESELMDIAMKYLVSKGEKPTADDIQAVRDILYPAFIANIKSSQKDILNHILSETKKHFPNE